MFKEQLHESPLFDSDVDEMTSEVCVLLLHNDDFNTFDHVINCLVDICEHDSIQAEQCAYIVHFNGKCDVKSGDYSTLKPLKDALIDKGLSVSIEKS